MTLDHRPTTAEMICPYCGVGCRLWAEAGYGEVLRVKAADAPANRGRICAKGATLEQTVATPDRLAHPLVRPGRGAPWQPVSWDDCLASLAGRFQQIISRHGPDAVAFYGSGQLDSQAVYCATKLFKGHLGTNNTDSNSRLCMATAVAAYRSSLGSDGPPTTFEDIELADTMLIAGSNMAEAHPVTFERIKEARRARPDVQLIVIDPRRTRTAEEADVHLAIRPGSDIALLNALGMLLLEASADDEAFIAGHTNGAHEYLQALRELCLDEAVDACGVSKADLMRVAHALAGRKWLSFYCMGLGQSTVGMWKINSLINLHLLTGAIARPGCGPFSLTGQPNAMGGREIGLLSHQLPGYRFVEDAEHRAEVEQYWQLQPGSINSRPGLTAVEMFRALERGQLKAIWIAATNPLVSLPDLHQVRRALQRAELVVVQEAFHPTETSEAADVLLPAASWGEREWTSTNSDRTVAHSARLVPPPGKALPDWEILCRFARRLGLPGFEFADAGEVWDEWIGLTAGRLCDMQGMPHRRLVEDRHLQWPCPAVDHPGTPRLYESRQFAHDDGLAVFHYRPHAAAKEEPDHEYPLAMTTGRVYSHWHTMTRTAKVRQLMRRDGQSYVEVHPDLAAQLGLADGDAAQLSSCRGTVRLQVRLSDRVPQQTVFVPIHWGDRFSSGNAVNYLTLSATGRVARQPEFKHCAVTLEPVAVESPTAPARAVEQTGESSSAPQPGPADPASLAGAAQTHFPERS